MIDTKDLESVQLFKGWTKQELERLSTLCRREKFEAQSDIIKDGEFGYDIFVLVEGKTRVFKHSESGEAHRLKTFQPGDSFGELAMVEEGKRKATVRAIEASTVIRIDGQAIKTNEAFRDLNIKIIANMAQLLSQRLDRTNNVTVWSMQLALDQTKEQVAMGLILVAIMLLAAGYEFALGFILSFKQYLPSTTPISVGMLVVYAAVLFFALKRGKFPLANYGLTWKNGWSHVGYAIWYSLPVLALVLLAKWVLINSFTAFENYPLFQPFAAFKTAEATSWSLYALTVLAYSLFSPIQEFIARGAIQGSLQLFLKKHWSKAVFISILLSNLVFASSHMHTSLHFAILAFVPGLFWGWMFHKQGSLIGVSVSHILIGVWVSFVVGLPGLA